MNTNNNDYVIVNGRKYFADGGDVTENVLTPIDISKPEHYYSLRHAPRRKSPAANNNKKSNNYGHQYFEALDDLQKRDFIQGRKNIYDFLNNEKHLNNLKKLGAKLDDFKTNTERFNEKEGKYIFDTKDVKKKGFNSDNDQLIYGYLSTLGRNGFTPDKLDGISKTQLGANTTESIGQFYNSNNLGLYVPNEVTAIKNILKNKNNKYADKIFSDINSQDWTRYEDTNGNKFYTITTETDENGNDTHNIVIALDKDNNPIKMEGNNPYNKFDKSLNKYVPYGFGNYSLDTEGEDFLEDVRDYSGAKDKGLMRLNSNGSWYGFRDPNNHWKNYNKGEYALEVLPNGEKGYIDKNNNFIKQQAFGGPTTRRIYAVGGTTGEQIPIGEQPEDYNMVANGGSHEQNPMGGVPYGMNQDGSQNMVEQGEVSVGNNVFSDRTAISPELCQQLGLPEGTSPAQAMQQIQALYEQGQIGDAEFQEIQQIIFDDQEAQKQNVGGSYQQGQVGGEGITPDMMQGQNMPPQAMPQQGAPEGIAPEMVQGGAYAFGGRRRC